jgi:hypothetical protein
VKRSKDESAASATTRVLDRQHPCLKRVCRTVAQIEQEERVAARKPIESDQPRPGDGADGDPSRNFAKSWGARSSLARWSRAFFFRHPTADFRRLADVRTIASIGRRAAL